MLSLQSVGVPPTQDWCFLSLNGYLHTHTYNVVYNCFWFSLFTQLFGLPHPSIADHQCTGMWPATYRHYWQQNAGSINGPFNQSCAFDVFFDKENFLLMPQQINTTFNFIYYKLKINQLQYLWHLRYFRKFST